MCVQRGESVFDSACIRTVKDNVYLSTLSPLRVTSNKIRKELIVLIPLIRRD